MMNVPDRRFPVREYEVYKCRLPNRSAGRGKSGGFRVIYYLRFAESVVLLAIYSKTDQSDISVREIQQLVAEASG